MVSFFRATLPPCATKKEKKFIYLFIFFYVVSTHNTTDGGCIKKKNVIRPECILFFSDLFITIHNEMSIWHRRKFSRGDE